MGGNFTILIIGGYGIFGGRIVELLDNEPRLVLQVAGRSHAKAKSFCNTRTGTKARLVPTAFDRSGDLARQLAALKPDLVVDASGPFQTYGADCYRVVEACIAQRIGYFDLADGSDFVNGVGAFDSAARGAAIPVLSGVSSFPVLTAAVVRHLSQDMSQIQSIRGGIAPSPFAGVGMNVIRAISAYAGQRTELRRNGEDVVGYPFTEQMRYTIVPPGRLPLRNTLFSLLDVPDLRALAELWPEARTIWMGAGPVPEPLHRGLIALSWTVRLGLLPSLLPLARLMHFVSNHVAWGEHRGGMFIEVEGTAPDGSRLKRSWHLLAEGDDGPLIPSMAVEALVRKWLAGHPPTAGARAATRDLQVEDYERLFKTRAIHTGIRDESSAKPLIYPELLGEAWPSVPKSIRDMHEGAALARGRAVVERGRNLLGRLVAALVGFPKPGTDVPVTVRFDVQPRAEIWTRVFGKDSFVSHQFLGTGRSDRLLAERFGPFTFAIGLVADGSRLQLLVRRWSVFGIPLPMWLCPRSVAHETEQNGRFHFHVEIGHPLTGLIVCYRGWLEIEA